MKKWIVLLDFGQGFELGDVFKTIQEVENFLVNTYGDWEDYKLLQIPPTE